MQREKWAFILDPPRVSSMLSRWTEQQPPSSTHTEARIVSNNYLRWTARLGYVRRDSGRGGLRIASGLSASKQSCRRRQSAQEAAFPPFALDSCAWTARSNPKKT